jgi:hypothetical protein
LTATSEPKSLALADGVGDLVTADRALLDDDEDAALTAAATAALAAAVCSSDRAFPPLTGDGKEK